VVEVGGGGGESRGGPKKLVPKLKPLEEQRVREKVIKGKG